LLVTFPNNRFLAWVYLLVHHAYCTNVAKTMLFACLYSKASCAVVAVTSVPTGGSPAELQHLFRHKG